MFNFFCLPPDGATTVYQISNRGFSEFLRTYYCDFRTTCIDREVFSVVVIGQWETRPVGIAVPQRRHCFCF